MKKLQEVYPGARGAIRVHYQSRDGVLGPEYSRSNVITFHAADIMAQLVAGNLQYRPSHIGFLYAPNTAVIPDPAAKVPPRDHTIDDVSDDLANPGVIGNMIVSPLNGNAAISIDGDDTLYEGNRASVSAISDSSGTPVFVGASFAGTVPQPTDNYFQVVLVARLLAPGSTTPVYKVFARAALNDASPTTGLPVQTGFELAVFWDITFF
jgi:hypothetical protein